MAKRNWSWQQSPQKQIITLKVRLKTGDINSMYQAPLVCHKCKTTNLTFCVTERAVYLKTGHRNHINLHSSNRLSPQTKHITYRTLPNIANLPNQQPWQLADCNKRIAYIRQSIFSRCRVVEFYEINHISSLSNVNKCQLNTWRFHMPSSRHTWVHAKSRRARGMSAAKWCWSLKKWYISYGTS